MRLAKGQNMHVTDVKVNHRTDEKYQIQSRQVVDGETNLLYLHLERIQQSYKFATSLKQFIYLLIFSLVSMLYLA